MAEHAASHDRRDRTRWLRYLVGTLPADEQAQLDALLAADAVASGQLDVAAGEIVQDYVAGTLPAEETAELERYFGSPLVWGRRQDLVKHLARVMRKNKNARRAKPGS